MMALALTACVAPQPAAPIKPLSKPVKDEMLSSFFAVMIASQCPEKLTVNEARFAVLSKNLNKELALQGNPEPSRETARAITQKSVSDKEVQDFVFSNVLSRDIDMGDKASWCRAGLVDVKRQTAVGKYLTLKR